MWKKHESDQRKLNPVEAPLDRYDWLSVIAAVIAGFCTHIYCETRKNLALFEDFSYFFYAGLSIAIILTRRWRSFPSAFERWRTLLNPAISASKSEIIRIRLNDIIDTTAYELIALASGVFELKDSPRIPAFSNKALAIVRSRVVLVMPTVRQSALRYYLGENGEPNSYYTALADAAARIKKRQRSNKVSIAPTPDSVEGATRIFYLRQGEDVTETVKQFIERHIKDGIDVRCLEKWPAHSEFEVLNHDFGYYETESDAFVITVEPSDDGISSTVIVDTRPEWVVLYRRFADQLCQSEFSKRWEEFWPKMLQPMNPNWNVYYAQSPTPLQPPHGMSPEDADALIEPCVRKLNSGDYDAFSKSNHEL